MKIEIRNPKPEQGPIRLRIKHLVLAGLPLPVGLAVRAQAAVAAELSRRLAAGDIGRL